MAELGDKKKPSGAQNRKRKLEKEEKIKKLTSPIDSFFRPASTSRWEVIMKQIPTLTLKPLSNTRWESRFDALRALRFNMDKIYDALYYIFTNNKYDSDTKNIASSLIAKLKSYRFICSVVIWYNILLKINIVSKNLQKSDVIISEATKMINLVKKDLEKYRTDSAFQQLLSDAKLIAEELECETEFKETARPRPRKRHFDYEAADEPILDPTNKFKGMFLALLVLFVSLCNNKMKAEPRLGVESTKQNSRTAKKQHRNAELVNLKAMGNDNHYLGPVGKVNNKENVIIDVKQDNVKTIIIKPQACKTADLKTQDLCIYKNSSAPGLRNLINSNSTIKQLRMDIKSALDDNTLLQPTYKTAMNDNISILQTSESLPVLSETAREKSIMLILKYTKNIDKEINAFRRGLEDVICSGYTLLMTSKQMLHESINNRLEIKTNHNGGDMDINLFLELVEITYSTFHHLSDLLKEGMQKAKRHGINKNFVIKVDIRKFVRYLSLQYEQNRKITETSREQKLREIIPADPIIGPPIVHLPYKRKSFEVRIRRKCMTYRISISKFNSFSKRIFRTLALMYNSGILSFDTNESKHVPAAHKPVWHVKDVTQGFMLTFLLKNCNMISLNVMRKLYFVIITSGMPNLTLMLNFKLTHGIFIMYNERYFEGYPFNFSQWKIWHNDAGKMARLLSNTICEVGRRISEIDHVDFERSTSNISYYESISTLENESVIESNKSEHLENSIYYTDSDLYDVKSNYDVDRNDSIITLTLSIDEILSTYDGMLDVKKACGDTNLTDILHENKCDIQETKPQKGKIWLSKVYNETISVKAGILSAVLDNLINERIFDKLTLDDYVHTIREYWMQFNTEIFVKLFFKQLGTTFFHTFFGSVINTPLLN